MRRSAIPFFPPPVLCGFLSQYAEYVVRSSEGFCLKKISVLEIATVFTGSFLGAGFLSGQELLQFFGVFGGYGLAGMVLAIAAFCLFSLLVMDIAKRTGKTEFDRIIVPWELPWLRGIVSGVFLFFLFDVMVAMIAGAGALLEQVFGLPAIAGNAAITLLVLAVALTGAAGMLASFNIVVPLLVVAAIVIGAGACLRLPMGPIEARPFASGNPLLGNWFFSALSFISYNMMAAVYILVPLTEGMEEKRTIHKGLAAGAVLLTLIFVCILLPMILFHALVGAAELPMLSLAYSLTPVLGLIYAVLLFAGMFTAALSSLFAITTRVQQRTGGALISRRFISLLCALAFVGSIFGFKNVVSFVYPICGYIGFFALAGILLHFFLLRRSGVGAGS